jgi:hypothetical protein
VLARLGLAPATTLDAALGTIAADLLGHGGPSAAQRGTSAQ